MRTIKFRGKRLDNEEWVYGYYACIQDPIRKPINKQDRITHRIYTGYGDSCVSEDGYDFSPDWVHIDPETVGQFTSLFDNNGKEIYEGDILALAGVETERLEVRFVRGVFAFLWNGDLEEECPLDAPTHCCVEVIGNIHDNPGLLKGGQV